MKSGILIVVLFFAGLSVASAQAKPKKPVAFKENVYQEVNAQQAQTLMYNAADIVVLDVRTPEEFAQGSLQKAVNIDFNAPDFKSRVNELDKSKTYLVFCRSGARSGKAFEMMKEAGFNHLYHLKGGLLDWPNFKLEE